MLTNHQRIQAIREYKAGTRPLEIGRRLGVTSSCISMIIQRAGLPRQNQPAAKKEILTPADEAYHRRQVERNRLMREFAANKRAAGCSTREESTLAAHHAAMERLALIPDDTRTLTARFCGDPLPGRSALDRRITQAAGVE